MTEEQRLENAKRRLEDAIEEYLDRGATEKDVRNTVSNALGAQHETVGTPV